GGERADVHLVDHRAVQGAAAPAAVGPAEGGMIIGAAGALDAERLARGARVGQELAVIQPEPVVDAGRHVGYVRAPPSGAAAGVLLSHRVALPGDLDVDPPRSRGPDAERGHRMLPSARSWNSSSQTRSGMSSATGSRLVSSSRGGRRPACLTPVNTSRQCSSGSGRAVSAQPPRRRRPAGSRVTTVTAWPPRRKANAWPAAGPSAASGV